MLKLVEAAGGKIDNIYYCPHTPNDNCECRKPKPGLFNKILTDYSFAISDVYAVGDSLRDLQAAYSSGIRNLFLVKTGNGEKAASFNKDELAQMHVTVVLDLNDFVNYIKN